MPMSAETELDCLVTTSRGHVPGHVTCRGSRYAHYDYDGVTVTLCMLSPEANVQQLISRYTSIHRQYESADIKICNDVTMKHTDSI